MEKVQVPFVVTYKDPRAIVFSDYTRAGSPDFESWFATYADEKLGYLRVLHDHFNSIAGRSKRVLRIGLEATCLNPRTTCEALFAHCGQDFSLRYLLLQNLRYSATRHRQHLAADPVRISARLLRTAARQDCPPFQRTGRLVLRLAKFSGQRPNIAFAASIRGIKALGAY